MAKTERIQPGTLGQGRKTGWGRRFRLPTADSNQELAGESACPTIFHELSRAEGPSQQDRKSRDRRSGRGAGASACQPRARIKSWQAKAPAPPFFMKFRGPKAHPTHYFDTVSPST